MSVAEAADAAGGHRHGELVAHNRVRQTGEIDKHHEKRNMVQADLLLYPSEGSAKFLKQAFRYPRDR